jgi:hypothetical protein
LASVRTAGLRSVSAIPRRSGVGAASIGVSAVRKIVPAHMSKGAAMPRAKDAATALTEIAAGTLLFRKRIAGADL